jgi:hypothetical protein
MMAFLPEPQPDELLYSILARHHRRLGISRSRWTSATAFGDRNHTAVIDLPGGLDRLLTNFPKGSRYSVEDLIARHTLAPLHVAFGSVTQRDCLVEAMCGSASVARGHAGVAASKFPQPAFLRYCPACFVEEVRSGEDPYWHRLHQVPWVEVCPKHGIFLENAFERRGARRERFRYFTPSDITGHLLSRKCSAPAAINIARATMGLLHRGLVPLAVDISKAYGHFFREAGLASRAHGFAELLWSRMRAELAGVFDRLKIETETPDWLLKFVRHPERCRSAWKHLMVLQALGRSVSDLDAISEYALEYDLSSTCPNPTCVKTKPVSIVALNAGARQRRLRCVICGFSFMDGPSRRVIDFGPLWKRTLVRLWSTDVSTREIARRLDCDSLTVVRHAQDLELPFPRQYAGRATGKRSPHSPSERVVQPEERERRRELWAAAAATACGRKNARETDPSSYAWLRRNDLSWLKANLPQRQPPHVATVSILLWKRREADFLARVEDAIERVRGLDRSPSFVALARELDATAVIPAKLHHMPDLAARVAEWMDSEPAQTLR